MIVDCFAFTYPVATASVVIFTLYVKRATEVMLNRQFGSLPTAPGGTGRWKFCPHKKEQRHWKLTV